MKTKEQRLVEIETAKLDTVKQVAEKSIEKQQEALGKAIRAFRKVCKHEKIIESDASDYHNNVQWTAKDCAICGMYLGKY